MSPMIFLSLSFLYINVAVLLATKSLTFSSVVSIVTTKNMTNRMTCRESYDHCADGNVFGNGGQKSNAIWMPGGNLMKYQDFVLSRCFCDKDECRKFGDCCPDIVLPEIQNAMNDGEDNQRVEQESWQCQEVMLLVKSKRKQVSIYMRTTCPSTWFDKDVTMHCHRRVSPSSLYDYTLDAPVISHSTNITYRNIYCAICNGDTTELIPLAMAIHCPKQDPNCTNDWSQWKYVPGQQRWSHIDKQLNTNVTFELVIPDKNLSNFVNRHSIRQCRKNVVDTCPINWTDDVTRHLCHAYSLSVSFNGSTGTPYKNKHCAICNGIKSEELIWCPSGTFVKSDIGGDVGLTHSYSLLIDFMGNNVENSGAIACGYGEICDTLRKRCRPFTCGRRFRLDENGRCANVKFEELNKLTDGDVLLLQDCPKISFQEDQFVFLSNDTIYINDTKLIYNFTDFELINETLVLVCASMPPNNLNIAGWKVVHYHAILSTVCVLLSLICLALHIGVHLYVPQLVNLPGKNLLSLSCALFVAQFLFTFLIEIRISPWACLAVASLIHLGFLASFFWMNVMAFDVCRTFSSRRYVPSNDRDSKNEFLKYSLYAWLTPLTIVIIAITNDFYEFLPGNLQPNYSTHQLCWINNPRALLVFFVAPLALLVTKNTVLFVVTVFGISRTTRATRFVRKDTSSSTGSGGGNVSRVNDRAQIVLYVKLALIMGLTWVFGLIASLANVEVLWYLFIVFNALEGAFIFFAFTFKRKVFRMVCEKYSGNKTGIRGSKSSFMKAQVTTKSIQSNNHNMMPASLSL